MFFSLFTRFLFTIRDAFPTNIIFYPVPYYSVICAEINFASLTRQEHFLLPVGHILDLLTGYCLFSKKKDRDSECLESLFRYQLPNDRFSPQIRVLF